MTGMEWPRATAAFFLPRRAVSRRYCAAKVNAPASAKRMGGPIDAARSQTLALRVLPVLACWRSLDYLGTCPPRTRGGPRLKTDACRSRSQPYALADATRERQRARVRRQTPDRRVAGSPRLPRHTRLMLGTSRRRITAGLRPAFCGNIAGHERSQACTDSSIRPRTRARPNRSPTSRRR